jgi:hypothetical protein
MRCNIKEMAVRYCKYGGAPTVTRAHIKIAKMLGRFDAGIALCVHESYEKGRYLQEVELIGLNRLPEEWSPCVECYVLKVNR